MKPSTRRTIFSLFEKEHRETLGDLTRLYQAIQRVRYEGKMNRGRNLAEVRTLTAAIHRELDGHMQSEEKTLFPFLRRHIPRLEPLVCLLLSEHDDFRSCLRTLRRSLHPRGIERVVEEGTYFVCLLRSHIWAEGHTLYRAADRELRLGEKRALIERLVTDRRAAAR